MFCKKCGKELTQDAKFCLHCGEPVAPEETEAKPREETKKKKGKAKFWLIGAASVLFAAGVLIAIFFANIVAWAERLILPPELLMTKAFASAAQDAGIGEFGSAFSLETPKRYSVGLYVDEDVQQLLSLLDEGDSTWITDLNLQIVAGKAEDLRKMQASVLVKEESVVSLDVIQNAEKAWLGIPELNERYLEITKDSLDPEGLTEKLHSGKALAQLFSNYGTILFDCVQRVTKENTTLKVGDIRQNVLQLTAAVSPEDAGKALSQVAKKLKEDEDARELLNAWTGEGSHAELVNLLEDLAEKEGMGLELITYLDSYNKLIGLELNDGDGNALLYWAKTEANGKFASRLACGSLVLAGNGTCTDEKQTGECRLTIDGETVLIYQLKDFAVNRNGFTGALIFPINQSLEGSSAPGSWNEPMNLVLSQKTVSGENVLSLCLAVGEKDLIGLMFTAENMNDFSVDAPTAVVSVNNIDAVEKWFERMDWNSIPEKLIEAGVPVDVMGILLEE